MRYAHLVILSEAKNLLVAKTLKQKQILRFAQNDKRRAPQDDSEGLSMTAGGAYGVRIYGTLH
ncbi:MAG: hypothetical protein A3J28_08385 [Acidobacteria bacterium RIFCSPLOWO2_12_FULL_60_22]|nr:MAG: hypothetical protein A3J28_08385 [Acidobacteria bacterium RIFCSPLOWO2_12_FULL_60_22]